MVENCEGCLGCRGSPLTARGGGQAHIGLLSLEHQYWEELPSQNPTVKISRNFVHLDETEGGWKPACHLNRPVHKLSHVQVLTLGSSKGTAAQKVPETFRERLSYVSLSYAASE